MTNKPKTVIKIKSRMIGDHFDESIQIRKKDYKHIVSETRPTEEELMEAIDVIVSAMAHNVAEEMWIDLDIRERDKTPVRKMTMDEIEKELGCRLEIINKEK